MLNSEFDKNIREKLESLNLDVNPSQSDISRIIQNLPNNTRSKLMNRLLYIIIVLLLLSLLLGLFNLLKRNNSYAEIVNLKHQVDSLYQETSILKDKLNDNSLLLSQYSNGQNSELTERIKKKILDSLIQSGNNFNEQIESGGNYYSTSNIGISKQDIFLIIDNDIELQKKIAASLLNKKEIQSSLSNFLENRKLGLNNQNLKLDKKVTVEASKKSTVVIDSNLSIEEKPSDSLQIKQPKQDTIFIIDKTQPKLVKTPIPINWSVGGGSGVHLANLETGGGVLQVPINGYVECLIGSHFSIASGLEFISIKTEKKPPFNNIDLNQFEELPFTSLDDVKEFKINLIYLDIPIELRCYILPKKKVNPFVSLGVQNRLLFKDQYLFEVIDNNEENYISTGKSVTQLNIGGLKFGAGVRFPISNRLDGTFRASYLQGFENLGSINNQLNSVGIDFTILYRLK